MISVQQRPHVFAFSKNQLLWRFYTTNPTEAGCQVDFKITVQPIGNTNPLLVTTWQTQVKPATDGYANIYAEDIIDSMINQVLPATAGAVLQVAGTIVQVQVEFRRISTATPSPSFISTEPLRYVIKGGIDPLEANHNNYFVNYHTPNKPFATWQPASRFIGLADEAWISILLPIATPQWLLKVNITWTDGTTDATSFTIGSGDLGKGMYHIRCGVVALGIDALAISNNKQLYKYNLQVQDVSNPATLYSQLYTFIADVRAFYNVQVFNFFNSLGGIDYLRILGDHQTDFTRSYTESERWLGSLIPSEPPATGIQQTNITRYNIFKGNTGYRHTRAELLAVQDIFTSTFIWHLVSAKARRVWLVTKGDKLTAKTDKMFAASIEWRYGFVSQVFTPMPLGLGNDLEIYDSTACPIPANMVATVGAVDGAGDVTVTFTWTGLPGVDYHLRTKINSAPTYVHFTVLTNPFNLKFFAGFPAGGVYNWQMKSICDPTNESAWTSGTDYTLP